MRKGLIKYGDKKMNKKGAAINGGVLILIVIALVVVWTQTTFLQDLLGQGDIEPNGVPGNCPSSGLTEVTLNTQEALAATATDSYHQYFVYDSDGILVTTGSGGSDGQSVFDVQCGVGKTYDVLVFNETAAVGFYAQTFSIDADDATFTENLKTYEYGAVDISNIGSSADPAGTSNVSSGLGKTCGFTITYTVNETASAFNKPLIMCESNITSVTDITMSGVTPADSKKPTRISTATGRRYWVFEQDEMIKSTDAAQKVSGKIQFSATTTPLTLLGNMTCRIVDQTEFKKSEYQTLSLNEGFIEAAEDDAKSDIGAIDSDIEALWFIHASGYC